MPSINIDLDYFDHPKTRRLIGLLGKGAEGLPIRLWCYCGRHHAESGGLTSYSAQEIESICAWWGQKGQMVEAMVRVGFLEELPDQAGYQVHDWQDHARHLVVYKLRAQQAAQAKREKQEKGLNTASSQLQGSLKLASSSASSTPKPSTKHNPVQCSTEQCSTEGREEKKRAVPAFALPDWVDPKAWEAYKRMRVKIRKPLTPEAEVTAISKLKQLKEEGHDPNKVLEESVFHSWQGLFPLKKPAAAGNRAAAQPGKYDGLGETV